MPQRSKLTPTERAKLARAAYLPLPSVPGTSPPTFAGARGMIDQGPPPQAQATLPPQAMQAQPASIWGPQAQATMPPQAMRQGQMPMLPPQASPEAGRGLLGLAPGEPRGKARSLRRFGRR